MNEGKDPFGSVERVILRLVLIVLLLISAIKLILIEINSLHW